MYLIFLYFFVFIFSATAISEDSIKVKTNFFKDLKLKPVDLELEDILTIQPLKNMQGKIAILPKIKLIQLN